MTSNTDNTFKLFSSSDGAFEFGELLLPMARLNLESYSNIILII